jgi:diguanylate cyclase (GGDEF)-like protein
MVIVLKHILKGTIIVKEHHYISIIYGILLTLGIVFCIGGLIFIPIHTYTINDDKTTTELTPTDLVVEDENVREFYFNNVDWKNNGNCLHFVSSHQEIEVKADNQLIFERKAVETIWGHTPGFSWEYIEIPEDAKNVTVTVTACYPSVRDVSIDFYQGFSIDMLQQVFREEFFTGLISFINVCVGVILLIYGTISRKRTSVGSAMVYLGIFTILLGVWSITENGIVAILVENRAGCSFISFIMLSLLGIPFVMFVRCYLLTDDKYLHIVLLSLNIISIILIYQLQFLGIRDMKQTLWITHISMLLSILYLPYSLIRMARQHHISRRFWVTIWSMFSMCPPLAYSLYLYYSGSHNVDSYGNVFVFVFIAFFAVDVTLSIIKDVDAGKKAAVYQELAEKDLLTGCYNRNAYRSDTSIWPNLDDVLLLTCDLNNLKQCNDTLGHAYGDRYITDSAKILKKVFSQYGKVYRIGGDEFCVIIPDRQKCDIESLLSTLTEEQRIYNSDSPVIHLQIACGYAEFDAKTDTNIEDIRNRADERMYENKKALKG